MFGRLGTSRKGLNAALGGQAGLSRKGGSQHGGGAGGGGVIFQTSGKYCWFHYWGCWRQRRETLLASSG